MTNEESLKEQEKSTRHNRDSWMGGLVLVLIGVAFLIANLTNLTLNNWWALFILIPLASALVNAWRDYQADGELSAQARNALVGSLIPAYVAVIFLFNLDWGRYWPGFLILGGVALLLRTMDQ